MNEFEPRADWTIEYPPGIIKYNDMFRHKFLDYDRIVDHLAPMYQKGNITQVADFGCGTGTLLFRFEERGFVCHGFDRNEETIGIALEIAKKRSSKATFEVGDMLLSSNYGKFDAVIQAFVPISLQSQVTTLRSMSRGVRPGGLYSFMVVEANGEGLHKDERTILNTVENGNCCVARIEPWKKNGNFIMWEPVLIVQDGNQFAMYIDHDELELYTSETWNQLESVIDDVGFKIIDILSMEGAASAPPWTTEKLVTVEHVGKQDSYS